VYWKSPFAALEAVGTVVWVVNARHVKAVPGRKTEMADAQWLVTLARAGLLRASVIPPLEFRQLRLVARQRQWHVGICCAEKNRLHKVLVDPGIRLNVLVSGGLDRQRKGGYRHLQSLHQCKGSRSVRNSAFADGIGGTETTAGGAGGEGDFAKLGGRTNGDRNAAKYIGHRA
jgi:hypothetical protein